MSSQPKRRINALDPRSNAVDKNMIDKALVREKVRTIRIIRKEELRQPVGFDDVPETPTGALEVFSANEFAFDAGILGRNIRRKFFG